MKKTISISKGKTPCEQCPFLADNCRKFVINWLGVDCNEYDLSTLKQSGNSIEINAWVARDEDERRITGGMFPEQAIDAKKFLEEYFKTDLTI